jgi:hypothetical protein
MGTFLGSTGELRENDSLPVLERSGNPCYTGGNHRLRGPARSSVWTTPGELRGGLENRAAGRGDGFRSGGGGQVSKARKRRATRRLPSHRKAAGHPAAFSRCCATPGRWERRLIR